MTLVKRLVLAFSAVVAVELIATLVISFSLGSFSSDDQNVAKSHAAILAVYEAQMVLSRQDTLLASYVATAERKNRDDFDGQVVSFEQALDQARNVLAGHAETMADIDQLSSLTKQWLESARKSMRFTVLLDETRDLRGKIADQAGRVVARLNESIADALRAKEHARHIVEMASLSGPSAGILVSIIMCIWLLTTLQKPMRALGLVVRSFAEGSLEAEIPHLERTDEIGTVARALRAFRDALLERGTLIQASMADKSRLADQDRMFGHVRLFEARIQRVLDHVNVQIGAMDDISQTLTGVASELTSRVSSAVSASQQTNSNVNTISAAVNELANSISAIAQQGRTLNTTFSQAQRRTKEATIRVADLTTASSKIGEVITLIRKIAGQTNLLALNATIEASRAGEAGKGFAVVAAEVKALASQTATATDEIVRHIDGIQASTAGTAEVMKDIARVVSVVNNVGTEIAAAVHQLDATTMGISNSMQQAAGGTHHVESNLSTVASVAGRTNQAAVDAKSASSDVALRTAELRGVIGEFLEQIAA
ncbi:methyl-accepting chemotaxis protein [Bradyrhizobium sp. CCBAU 21360]|uniref:methyl-accepting chemotaxis protein n=1 Tax=Bradyrhizobium sp. CCBAU 21360 TaxID=1325081 RepID=UPI0023053946|nr:HAMP domain-containing methyl-accepting chemotaxis protein [Bradyrhizobium sp. CCBAU 21360]